VTDSAANRIIVVKVGGAVADTEGALLSLSRVQNAGFAVVVMHGGGREISSWMAKLDLPVSFKEGLRVTDAASMEIAMMVLRGKVSTELVGALVRQGIRAVGLSGVDAGLIEARPHPDPEVGLVGEVGGVNTGLLHLLVERGYVPVLAPIAEDSMGRLRNINADSLCGAVAGALDATLAIFLTDVPGVKDPSGAVYPYLTPARIETLIDDGTIQGGMVPKVRACLEALSRGARAACIADGRNPKTLEYLWLGGKPSGTVVTEQGEVGGWMEEAS
jgi:acetylglutamate kinase